MCKILYRPILGSLCGKPPPSSALHNVINLLPAQHQALPYIYCIVTVHYPYLCSWSVSKPAISSGNCYVWAPSPPCLCFCSPRTNQGAVLAPPPLIAPSPIHPLAGAVKRGPISVMVYMIGVHLRATHRAPQIGLSNRVGRQKKKFSRFLKFRLMLEPVRSKKMISLKTLS